MYIIALTSSHVYVFIIIQRMAFERDYRSLVDHHQPQTFPLQSSKMAVSLFGYHSSASQRSLDVD